jgi:hypothetical protein
LLLPGGGLVSAAPVANLAEARLDELLGGQRPQRGLGMEKKAVRSRFLASFAKSRPIKAIRNSLVAVVGP